ncbi:hypothetical protein Tco_1164185 [Tanacetum coccineum]
MDVKTGLLKWISHEEVYMEQPEGFVNPKYPKRVSTPAELKRMQNVPYASVWVLLCVLTGRVPSKAFSLLDLPDAELYCFLDASKEASNESGITKGARHFRAKVHYLREVIEFGT